MTNPIVPAENLVASASAIPTLPGGAAPIEPWPGTTVQLDVGEVFVRSTPAHPGAEAALFVHGLGGSALNWTDLMGQFSRPAVSAEVAAGDGHAELASHDGHARLTSYRHAELASFDGRGEAAAGAGLRCEALDLPGFGYSPPPADGDYSLAARAAAVISLIEKRGYWPVHLVGNSLGGAIATKVAARRPDLVRTLTLISPALPDLRPRPLPMRLALVSAPGVGRWLLGKMQELPPEQRTDKSIAELYANPALFQPERRKEAITEVIRRDGLGHTIDALLGSTRSLVAEYTRPGPGSLWRDAARVFAPTLLVHGSHDRLVNPGMSGRAARTFRNCRVVVLPRIGHVAMMERPDLVAAEMREFLCSTTASAAGGRGTLSRASR